MHPPKKGEVSQIHAPDPNKIVFRHGTHPLWCGLSSTTKMSSCIPLPNSMAILWWQCFCWLSRWTYIVRVKNKTESLQWCGEVDKKGVCSGVVCSLIIKGYCEVWMNGNKPEPQRAAIHSPGLALSAWSLCRCALRPGLCSLKLALGLNGPCC